MARVNINIDRGIYKLRWSHQSKRYSLSIGVVSKTTVKAANAKAKLIESDLLFERFDVTLAKYSAKYKLVTSNNVLVMWEQYKSLNSSRVALTTQKECWSQVDRCLAKVDKCLLTIGDILYTPSLRDRR